MTASAALAVLAIWRRSSKLQNTSISTSLQGRLDESATILGTAEVFMTLRESRRSTLDVLDTLPRRLGRVLPPGLCPTIEKTARVLREACFSAIAPRTGALPDGENSGRFPSGDFRHGMLVLELGGQD